MKIHEILKIENEGREVSIAFPNGFSSRGRIVKSKMSDSLDIVGIDSRGKDGEFLAKRVFLSNLVYANYELVKLTVNFDGALAAFKDGKRPISLVTGKVMTNRYQSVTLEEINGTWEV